MDISGDKRLPRTQHCVIRIQRLAIEPKKKIMTLIINGHSRHVFIKANTHITKSIKGDPFMNFGVKLQSCCVYYC